jgi:hypothetical protein
MVANHYNCQATKHQEHDCLMASYVLRNFGYTKWCATCQERWPDHANT